MKKSRQNKLLWCLLLSLLLHGALLLRLTHESVDKPEPLAPLDVEILPTPKRLADIQKPKEEKRPEKADFIGQYDSTVKEEKVAVTQQPPGVQKPQPTREQPPEEKATPTPEKKKQKLADLFAEKKAAKKQDQGQPPWQQQGAFPQDFYPDYKVGPHTYLNVLRYPNIGYFVRLKRIFKLTFNPIPVLRRALATPQVSRGHVEVVLGVEVDRSGRLAKLFVIRGSGFKGYDQEALRTVRDSSPFSKPPEEIIGSDGVLRMSWTFTVYL